MWLLHRSTHMQITCRAQPIKECRWVCSDRRAQFGGRNRCSASCEHSRAVWITSTCSFRARALRSACVRVPRSLGATKLYAVQGVFDERVPLLTREHATQAVRIQGAWLRWLERSLHTAEVAGSSPAAPTHCSAHSSAHALYESIRVNTSQAQLSSSLRRKFEASDCQPSFLETYGRSLRLRGLIRFEEGVPLTFVPRHAPVSRRRGWQTRVILRR
jgi:hypothetical protein